MFFSDQRAHWIVADFRKKIHLISEHKEHSNKTSSIQEIKKHLSSYGLFFSSPPLTFIQIAQKLFLFRSPH